MATPSQPAGVPLRLRLRALRDRVERFLVPDELLPDGRTDQGAVRLRYRRVVWGVCAASVLVFFPSLPLAGVPVDLWAAYAAGVLVTAVVVGASLVFVPSHALASIVAALVSAIVIAALDRLIGPYFHQASLLFALVVAGQAIIHGLRAAVAMGVAGALLLPYASIASDGPAPTDFVYALTYLLSLGFVVWSYKQLQARSSAAVSSSEAKYRHLVERMPAVAYSTGPGPDAAWAYVSPNITALLGYEPDEVLRPGFWCSRVHPEDRDRIRSRVLAHWSGAVGDRMVVEARVVASDGRTRWISDESILVADGDGLASYRGGLLTDVTDRKDLEARLEHANRIEAVGQLAGGIAHDFNNLLTAIRGYGELARDEAVTDGRDHADIDELLRAADRATSLTSQLLAFSRRQALQPTTLDPAAVIEGLAPMLRRLLGEQVALRLQQPDEPVWIKVDQTQLEQVLVNLAVNARDAMPAGGELRIATSIVADEVGQVDGPGTPTIRITVTDTGVGMDANTLGHMFEPFFTTKGVGKGTGMGLATVYGIVTQSGGTVTCSSVPARGTTFVIELPSTDPPTTMSAPLESRPVPRGVGCVLLVEDEPLVRALAARLLASLGYAVRDVGGGMEALPILADPTQRVDLLLTDVMMPGMLGTELATRARALRPGLAVVLMSGYVGSDRPSERLPDLPLLAKPFHLAGLGWAVHDALESAGDPQLAPARPGPRAAQGGPSRPWDSQ